MKRILLSLALLLATPAISSAHFLWLVTQPDGSTAKVQVFFGEEAGPDDPALLEKVLSAQVWSLGGRGEPKVVTLTKGEEALEGSIERGGDSPVILSHPYGVITKGGDSFLLKYYAKAYPSPLVGTWNEVADQERLPLEITPTYTDGQISLKVTWKDKPVADSQVVIVGPGISEKIEGTTNAEGVFATKLPQAGTFSIRAKHSETASGEHDGKSYSAVRHYSTLTLKYQPVHSFTDSLKLPDLPQGTTSFGGAVANDRIYVFGGNYGDAHSYFAAGQSGDLYTLDLNTPQAWTKASVGPKLQGLSMAAHNGRIYRVGGFAAMNQENEEENLVSQPDFARLSADGTTWEALPNLPMGRSSHDVAVVGDKLYVIGGWCMTGSAKEAVWHDNLLAYDLTNEKSEWVELARPTHTRRAIAAAAWNGKLAVVGGMFKNGGPTTVVEIYDPATNQWSSGPAIHGGMMDGFGCSAFSVGDQLVVTTMTGSIQSLGPEQAAWNYLGQVSEQRFFHRMLPLDSERLVLVGGGNMEGKALSVEVLKFPARAVAER